MAVIPISVPIVCCGAVLFCGYWAYGGLSWYIVMSMRPFFPSKGEVERVTPAKKFSDGMDFVPARLPLLMAQHFSTIAAAGPILGPTLAAIYFGWLPTLLWLIFGSIFIGGVHDFIALVASVRYDAKSIAHVAGECMSKRARILVLLYTEISLVYVIIAFADVTAGAFVQVGTELDPDDQVGAKAGSSSCMYLAVGLAMGIVMKLLPKAKLWMLTPPFLILVIGTIVAGEYAPLPLNQRTWDMLLLSYCWFAAIAPAWLLLQPRGYLGGFFLYTTLVGICLGITVSLFTSDVGFPIEFPAWRGYGEPPMQLFPVLFITVACGACSGFHAVVSSGTTAKQLSRERDALPVSYGAMLLESFVAVLSCSTIMIMSEDDPLIQKADAQACYARGVSSYLYVIGKPLHIPLSLLYNFAMMAFATFVCDTLDVATRLGRIVLQELIPWKPKTRVTQAIWHLCCTTSVLVLPFLILGFSPTMVDPKTGAIIPLWRSMWGLFGSCNQLFAALVLLIGSAWLASKGKKWALSGIPMLIMFTVATVALIETSVSWIQGFSTAGAAGHLVGVCSTLMLILCAFFVFEACASLGTYVLPSYVLRKLSSFRDSMLAKFHKLKEDPEDVIGAPMDQLSS